MKNAIFKNIFFTAIAVFLLSCICILGVLYPYFSEKSRQDLEDQAAGLAAAIRLRQKGIDDVQQQARAKSHRTAAVTALIGLAVGVLAAVVLARFVFGWGTTKLDSVAPTLADTELSCVVGTYTYNGETFDITAREAIEGTQSLSYSLNADGTYDAPSSDMVLAYARNQVLAQIAADAGITASAASFVRRFFLNIPFSAEPAKEPTFMSNISSCLTFLPGPSTSAPLSLAPWSLSTWKVVGVGPPSST